MGIEYLPGSYEYTFGKLTAEEKKQMEKNDIPTVIVGEQVKLTDEQKSKAENLLNKIREKKQ